METGKEVVITSSQLAIYDTQESVLNSFKEAEKIKCEDAESRKVLGKYRADAKSIRAKIEKARLDKNREQVNLNNEAAKAINDRLTSSIEVYDQAIQPYDQIAIDRANERKRLEEARVAEILKQLASLTALCASPLAYNISSDQIKFRIDMIAAFEIDEGTFQENMPQAEMTKISALAEANRVLEGRIKWEEQQKEAEKIAEQNRIEADKMAKERAEFKAEHARIAAEQKKKEDEAALIAAQEAEKSRIAAEKLEADRLALEKREADLKAKEDAAKAKEELEKKIAWATDIAADYYAADCDNAHKENIIFDSAWARAKEIDMALEKEKLKANKARAKLITADKKNIQAIVNKIDKLVSENIVIDLKTDEGSKVIYRLYGALKEALSVAEIAGSELA